MDLRMESENGLGGRRTAGAEPAVTGHNTQWSGLFPEDRTEVPMACPFPGGAFSFPFRRSAVRGRGRPSR
jgi:hypothetical protein